MNKIKAKSKAVSSAAPDVETVILSRVGHNSYVFDTVVYKRGGDCRSKIKDAKVAKSARPKKRDNKNASYLASECNDFTEDNRQQSSAIGEMNVVLSTS